MKTTDKKICDVIDWGTETTGELRKITRGVFETDTAGYVEIYTSPTKHSGLYSTETKSEIIEVVDLLKRYGSQLNDINI